MTTNKPIVNQDSLYQSGAAAKLLGISTSTLHRHTEAGDIPYHIRKCNGRKVWKGSDLVKFWNEMYS